MQEYLLTNEDNDESDFSSDSELCDDVESDSSELDEEFGMRKSDYDRVLDRIVAAQEIVGDDDEEKNKARNFR